MNKDAVGPGDTAEVGDTISRHLEDSRMHSPRGVDEVMREFRSVQSGHRRTRDKPYSNHLRIALFQFDVDETYSHPLSEACLRGPDNSIDTSLSGIKSRELGPGASWSSRQDLFSCAEARRRGLLEAALRACKDFDVEVLLLPEYSVRPETLNWIAQTLRGLKSNLVVWAGTFRIPSSGMDMAGLGGALSPQAIEQVLHPSAAILCIINKEGVVAARGKRYPSVALGEQFRPFLNNRKAITPMFMSASCGSKNCQPGDFITELICSEIFMATSPANLNSITQSLRQLYELYAAPSAGKDLSFIEEAVLADLQEFADRTSMAPRYSFQDGNRSVWSNFPRRTLLLVPSMSPRAVDFHILGQANYLAAGMCMIFCNAVCPPFGSGESCFIGHGSTRGDSNHRYYDDRLGPYNGVHPGIFRDGCFNKGALGKEEQALVIVDVDPVYMNEGRPRQQLLHPPLSLVAHLPVIEYPSKAFCDWRAQRLVKTEIDPIKRRCSCTSKRNCAKRRDVYSLTSDITVLLKENVSLPDLHDDPDRNAAVRRDVENGVSRLACLQPGLSPWLSKRCEAFRDASALIQSQWPPPALYDFLLVETGYGFNEKVDERDWLSIDVPAIDPYFDSSFGAHAIGTGDC